MSAKRNTTTDPGLTLIDDGERRVAPHRVADFRSGLAEIEAWRKCFLEGHRRRLEDMHVDEDRFNTDFADCTRLAEAMVLGMKTILLARCQS